MDVLHIWSRSRAHPPVFPLPPGDLIRLKIAPQREIQRPALVAIAPVSPHAHAAVLIALYGVSVRGS